MKKHVAIIGLFITVFGALDVDAQRSTRLNFIDEDDRKKKLFFTTKSYIYGVKLKPLQSILFIKL